jgi:hypothetical protein
MHGQYTGLSNDYFGLMARLADRCCPKMRLKMAISHLNGFPLDRLHEKNKFISFIIIT